MKRVSIFLTAIALIAGMVSCGESCALAITSTAGGNVTTPGEGIFTYSEGTVVNLTAEAEEGYHFVNWTDDVSTIANVEAAATNITMNGDYSIVANFEEIPPVQYNLTSSSTAGGNVTIPGEGTFTYNFGTVVSLNATPDSGYQFVNWTGNVSTIGNVNAAMTNITMNDNYSITANFEEIPPVQYILTINSTEGGSVTDPGEGTFAYNEGAVVNLVAVADEGYSFCGWTGDVSTIVNGCPATPTTITMNGDYSITANFGSVYGDFSDLLNQVITSQGEIELRPGTEVNPSEGEHAPVEYYAGPWPTAEELSAWYGEDVEGEEPYGSGTIDLNGVSMELGPLYRDGTLEIKNSSNTPATLTLTGTVYITGHTFIGTTGKDFTLDLNGQTIFVASNTTGSQKALWIGDRASLKGPGCVIAVGDIYYAPKQQVTTDPIFVLSVSGTTLLQPNGNIYGAVAGSVEVDLQVGMSLTYPEAGFGSINFPGCS